jgi:transcriptional regulator with XRE-family HTH domain
MVGMDTIGARIKYWRMRRGGMMQAVLAGLAGVSQSYISQVEAGRLGAERRATLVAIAKALRVTVADLVGQPGDSTDPLKADATGAVPAIWAALVEIGEERRAACWLSPTVPAATRTRRPRLACSARTGAPAVRPCYAPAPKLIPQDRE